MQVLGIKYSSLCPQEAHYYWMRQSAKYQVMEQYDSVPWDRRKGTSNEGKVDVGEGLPKGWPLSLSSFHRRTQVCQEEWMTEGIPERNTA